MKTQETNVTVGFYPKGDPGRRLFALWYFTPLLIMWTILGHTVLGFEQSWAQVVVGLVTGLSVQGLLEWVNAKTHGRPPRFQGGWPALADFLPPAIIPGLACAMLLYPNEHLWPIAFAVAASISSKVLIRAPLENGKTQHVFNPSNFGIVATLLLLPWVGFAPPYHFTRNLTGAWNWALPVVVLLSGVVVHAFFTGRLPLCAAWVGGFVLQGLIRSWVFGSPWFTPLVPMTSAAFVIFTLYMVPDPATTPIRKPMQILFGLSVALVYGSLLVSHMVFGLFLALAIVAALRGTGLYLKSALRRLEYVPSQESSDGTIVEAD